MVYFDIKVASDGCEAVAIFKEFHKNIKLIIMDIQMPKLDGFEAT